MNRLVLTRHAESELNVLDVLNGDVAVAAPLTERGREQARRLGREAGPVDFVAHTEFGRTLETAELAWPTASRLVVADLNEIRFGSFEGTRWADGYGPWAEGSGPLEGSPGGGESRAEAVLRYARGYRTVLDRTEQTVAVVTHGAPIRYILLALAGHAPRPVLEPVPPAAPFSIERERLERAVDSIEAWAREPVWR